MWNDLHWSQFMHLIEAIPLCSNGAAYCLRPCSIFCDIIVRILWFSITRRQLMYDRTSPSLFGDGGSSTATKMRTRVDICRDKKKLINWNVLVPKCLERQNRIVRMVCAIICIFSKFTSPSKLVLLPSCANVMSFSSRGMNGITGGCNFPTKLLYWRGLL